MKLEVGKYYRTRDGRKAGPLDSFREEANIHDALIGPVQGETRNFHRVWKLSGEHEYNEKNLDLISEWEDEMKITMDGKYAYRKDPYTQVRILCVDRNHPHLPVISLGGEVEYVSYHHASGMAVGDGWDYDLVPLQEKLPDLWVNIYSDGNVYNYLDESLARRCCGGRGKTIKYIPAPDQTS